VSNRAAAWQIARIALDGTVTHLLTLPSASYSTHAVRSGGYVVGTTYELDNDVSPAGWTRGSLWGSVDGWSWEKLLDVPQLDPKEDCAPTCTGSSSLASRS